jgi:hypothetical protein
MKSLASKIVLSLSISALIVPAGFVVARTSKNSTTYGAVTVPALGVDEPAILASNPFYGLTDLVRGMKDSFASGRLNKASVKLDTLNLKAAQLLKIRSIAPDNTKSITKALNEYQLASYQYTIALARLTADDFKGEDAAGAVSEFINSSLVNLRFIDDLLATTQTNSEQALLGEVFERLAQGTVKLFVDVIGFANVRVHIIGNLPTDSLIAIRNAEMIAGLAKEATAMGYTDAAQEFMSLRVSLLDDIADALVGGHAGATAPKLMSASLSLMPPAPNTPVSHLQANQISEFSILAGSAAERIQTLSYLLSTEQLAQDTDLIALRNQLLIKVFSK